MASQDARPSSSSHCRGRLRPAGGVEAILLDNAEPTVVFGSLDPTVLFGRVEPVLLLGSAEPKQLLVIVGRVAKCIHPINIRNRHMYSIYYLCIPTLDNMAQLLASAFSAVQRQAPKQAKSPDCSWTKLASGLKEYVKLTHVKSPTWKIHDALLSQVHRGLEPQFLGSQL